MLKKLCDHPELLARPAPPADDAQAGEGGGSKGGKKAWVPEGMDLGVGDREAAGARGTP